MQEIDYDSVLISKNYVESIESRFKNLEMAFGEVAASNLALKDELVELKKIVADAPKLEPVTEVPQPTTWPEPESPTKLEPDKQPLNLDFVVVPEFRAVRFVFDDSLPKPLLFDVRMNREEHFNTVLMPDDGVWSGDGGLDEHEFSFRLRVGEEVSAWSEWDIPLQKEIVKAAVVEAPLIPAPVPSETPVMIPNLGVLSTKPRVLTFPDTKVDHPSKNPVSAKGSYIKFQSGKIYSLNSGDQASVLYTGGGAPNEQWSTVDDDVLYFLSRQGTFFRFTLGKNNHPVFSKDAAESFYQTKFDKLYTGQGEGWTVSGGDKHAFFYGQTGSQALFFLFDLEENVFLPQTYTRNDCPQGGYDFISASVLGTYVFIKPIANGSSATKSLFLAVLEDGLGKAEVWSEKGSTQHGAPTVCVNQRDELVDVWGDIDGALIDPITGGHAMPHKGIGGSGRQHYGSLRHLPFGSSYDNSGNAHLVHQYGDRRAQRLMTGVPDQGYFFVWMSDDGAKVVAGYKNMVQVWGT